jgi:hypothetical protein
VDEIVTRVVTERWPVIYPSVLLFWLPLVSVQMWMTREVPVPVPVVSEM